MRKINPEILKILRHRFDDQVSEADILSWLYNFDETDWEKALRVLEHVTFYSERLCIIRLKEGLKRIIDANSNRRYVLYPIGGTGKSGNVMAYYINKFIGKQPFTNICFYSDETVWKKKNVFILFDDFSGSGKSVAKCYDSIKDKIPQNTPIYCLTVAYSEEAAKNVNALNINIEGVLHKKAFAQRGSIFGYPQRMRPIRDFAKRYGELICPTKKGNRGVKYTGPLGYNNGQMLVCFDHTTPNNSIPILWASYRRTDNSKKWRPLFPRFLDDRVRGNESYQEQKYYWLSIARKISEANINKLFNNYDKDCIQLLGLLYGKIHHRSTAYICNMLAIPLWRYVKLVKQAQSHKLLDKDEMPTEIGRTQYQQIRYKIVKTQVIEEIENIPNDIVYTPKQFLGYSRYRINSEESKEPQIPLDLLQSL